MQRVTDNQREAFMSTFRQHLPEGINGWDSDVQRTMRLILRHGRTLGRLAEEECSYERTERQQAYAEKQEAHVTARVEALAKSLGCGVVFSGDPRGHVVKLIMPDGFTDDWGNTGFCVPTS